MKRKIKTLFFKPITLVLIFILIVFLPAGISAPPEGVERQHIASIGIDLAPEGLELSVLSHVSSQSDKYRKSYIINSAKANSIPDALFLLSSTTGRQSALTHTTTIVVSEAVAQNNLHNYLDYFYRNDNVANDTYVVCTPGKAKDLLNFEKQRINSTGYGLEEVMVFNSKSAFYADSNLESFYKGYFSPTHTSLLAIAELEDNPDGEQVLMAQGQNSDAGGAGQSSQSGGNSGGSSPKRLKNVRKLAVLKYGNLVDYLTTDLIFGLNVATNGAHDIFLKIDNFSDEHFQNATLEFNIATNRVKYLAEFRNNKPILTMNSLISLSVETIKSAQSQKEYFFNGIVTLSPKLKQAVAQNLKDHYSKFIKKCIENKADILGIYTIFNNQTAQKFLPWFESLDNPLDFLSDIEYRMVSNPILTK